MALVDVRVAFVPLEDRAAELVADIERVAFVPLENRAAEVPADERLQLAA